MTSLVKPNICLQNQVSLQGLRVIGLDQTEIEIKIDNEVVTKIFSQVEEIPFQLNQIICAKLDPQGKGIADGEQMAVFKPKLMSQIAKAASKHLTQLKDIQTTKLQEQQDWMNGFCFYFFAWFIDLCMGTRGSLQSDINTLQDQLHDYKIMQESSVLKMPVQDGQEEIVRLAALNPDDETALNLDDETDLNPDEEAAMMTALEGLSDDKAADSQVVNPIYDQWIDEAQLLERDNTQRFLSKE